MSTNSSKPPGIAWNWVIEALANFEHVDASTLIGLVKRAPAISYDLGKDAREMVSFRILENLFIQGNETAIDTDSGQNAKIGFDPSKRCEDVLRQILDETSELTESEKQKWDIRPFLLSKRSSLTKCPLKKLKEAILEGSDPLLASLKEKSRLIVANRSEDISTVFDRNSIDQTKLAKDDLVPLNPIGDDEVQENQLQEANRVENCVRETTEHARREENEMLIEPPVEGLDENTSIDHNEHASSMKPGQSCEVANSVHDLQQLPDNNDNVLQDTYREGQDQRVLADSMKKLEFVGKLRDTENSIQQNASNGCPSEPKDSIEHDGQLETGTDSDRSDDERTDIASKKEAFLSSQCILSQDSMAMADWTEINLCAKCNEGGQLLLCSSVACPLRVHETCLGFAATLDENGKFFCPFCVYSRAISMYLEVKRKASLARKDLQAFCNLGLKRRPKRSGERQSGSTLGENTEEDGNGDPANGANNGYCLSNKEDTALPKSVGNNDPSFTEQVAVSIAEHSMLAEPSRGCANGAAPSGDNVVSVANGTNRGLAEAEGMGQEKDKESTSPTRMEEQQLSSQVVSGCEPRTPSSKGNESDRGSGEHRGRQLRSRRNHPNTYVIDKPILQPSTPTKTCKEKGSPNSVSSTYTRNLRKRKAQYTYPAIPSLRRKKLPWTELEEEKLKEGMQRFSSVDHKKGIPWTEILEFGRDVFHKSRTTIDLKDKWRNLCKRSPKPN